MQNNGIVTATLKKIRVSPQKLNIVAAMIRGMSVESALAALLYSRKRISTEVRKTLLAAQANAENNHGLVSESLYVKEAYVGRGLTLKRFHPRGRGRGGRVVKPFSRLSVVVAERG
jgi:large subunit ribosomal protein L22